MTNRDIIPIGKYYLYRHIRLDTNEVFYVGIGAKKNRIFKSYNIEFARGYNKYKRSHFWEDIVNKTKYEVEILMESDDYEFIKKKEIEFIALYGRRDLGKGSLVNLTDGGEGTINYVYSEERKERARVKMLERFSNGDFDAYKVSLFQYNLKGEFIKKWNSIREACTEYNMPKSTIQHRVRDKSKSTSGYIWLYLVNKIRRRININRKKYKA